MFFPTIVLIIAKAKLQWIKDLHVGPETLNLIEENIDKKPLNIILGNNFLCMWHLKDR